MRSLLLLVLLGTGCAARTPIPGPLRQLGRTSAPPAPEAVREQGSERAPPDRGGERERDEAGRAIARAARHYLNHSLEGFRDDCSGFVCAATSRAGRPVSGNTLSIWADLQDIGATHHRKVPRVGDLAFFDNTYDRNGDGRLNDELTHVGIVIQVLEDRTVVLAHGGTSQGRSELRLNLQHPDDHLSPGGEVRNDYLRRRRDSDPAGTPHLAGQMWRGFATLPD